ncbi:hypothetical protein AVJ23_05290 [Pseudoponticoccus marisrubri]|uniref:HTH LytTR-type domain-containing protein n=2 Tax=Pseudoponticoccus marisrubri TaxID=1685382 RepID=A0A0W7WN49_9RHOB|nr:hypothetical protein AVJ23_05290 [Pseudoponticoccus marisrubri]
MTHPATLASLAGIGAVAGIAGPFGTDALLPLVPRLGYWLVLVTATYGAGVLAGEVLGPRLGRQPAWLRVTAVGSLTGVLVWGVVLGLNLLFFAYLPGPRELPGFLATLFVIALIVTAVLHVAGRHLHPAAPEVPAPTKPPALLERLPLDKRAPLVALSVEDHYVRVRTTKGEELLLMRLGDAIRETDGVRGAQVHRSHWAAFGQVQGARRVGDRAILTMTDGTEIPVSRANVPRIREAGLLPR